MRPGGIRIGVCFGEGAHAPSHDDPRRPHALQNSSNCGDIGVGIMHHVMRALEAGSASAARHISVFRSHRRVIASASYEAISGRCIRRIRDSRGRRRPRINSVVIYSQPPKSSGGLIPSSWREPDGSATDRFAWENFGFENAQTISEVRWRGGYDPAKKRSGGPVRDFTVDIYRSIPAGSEPDLASAPLVHYRVGGNAGETPADVLGGVQTYDYRFVLPAPFEVAAATTYWLQIEAFQSGEPDWGLSIGTGTLGDGRHFRGVADGYYYQLVLDDAAIGLAAAASMAPRPSRKSPHRRRTSPRCWLICRRPSRCP